jgi:two-component system cell cycle sensor histidine kinase/response regulator CckA
MSTSTHSQAGARTSARHSLSWRLTVTIILIGVTVLALFGWAAHMQVEMSLLRAGADRAKSATTDLADMLERSLRQNREDLILLASRPDLRAFVMDPGNAQFADALRLRLNTTPVPGIRRVEIWNDSGTRLLEVVRKAPGIPSADALPQASQPTASGFAPMQAVGDVVFTDLTEEIRDGPGADAKRLGFILIRSTVTGNPEGAVGLLIGPDATFLMGNQSGDVWSDLVHRVAAPHIDLMRNGSATYAGPNGVTRMGALATVRATPYAVWVEFPRAAVVAPALTFLRSITIVGLLLIIGGSFVIRTLTRRMTTPLVQLSDAAESIAAGDYARRAPGTTRRDEIGRLSGAFNLMAEHVQTTHEGLETRVLERTAALVALQSAEAALVESERAFRSTFDDAPLGIAQVSVDGKWIRVNRHLESILGWHADELAGQNLFDIFQPGESAVDKPAASEPGDREERVRRKDGQFVWVRLTISPVRNDAGVPRHLIVIIEDVSERRRLEERLRESEKLEAIGRLAGGVAHDFNNLLTAIIGYAQLVADSLDHDDPKADDVDEIIKAAERSAALTGQLLAFSRKQVLVPAILDVNTLVRETTVLLRRVIGEHIDLVTTLTADLEPVSADRSQLEQIIINLAANARDAMPSGGRLTIETANAPLDEAAIRDQTVSEPGRYVMLAVSDTGVGMDTETKLRVFEPFFTTKEQGRGTGLGLATVYGIVKQSGGFISVHSEPHQGATFRVYLPAVPGAKASVTPRETKRSDTQGHETILVVEDEGAVRTMTRLILERAGYSVVEAAAPGEAQEIFRARPSGIDLMISDVVMPGAHGPALFKQLVVEHPSLRVLYMSGYADDEIIRAGRLEGGENFMEKPFTSQRLLERVREILDT